MTMSLRDKIMASRDRFQRLDRKWHLLIGSQLLFGMFLFRAYNLQSQGKIDSKNNSLGKKTETAPAQETK